MKRSTVPSRAARVQRRKGKTVIYARSAQASIASIRAQVQACKGLVRDRRVSKVYKDDGSSGNEIGPGLKQLLADARQGRIAEVIVEEHDRLARSPPLQIRLHDSLEHLGVMIRAVRGPSSTTFLAAGQAFPIETAIGPTGLVVLAREKVRRRPAGFLLRSKTDR